MDANEVVVHRKHSHRMRVVFFEKDAFIEDFLSWSLKEFGVVQMPTTKPEKFYESLTVQLHDIMRPAGRVIEVQMRERLPTSTESEDLNAILAAAVGGALDDRVEAGNVAATSKYADALYRHSSKTIASTPLNFFRSSQGMGPLVELG